MIIVKSFKNNYLIKLEDDNTLYLKRIENGKVFVGGIISENQFEEKCRLPTTKEHFTQNSPFVQDYIMPLFQQYERKKKLEKLLK